MATPTPNQPTPASPSVPVSRKTFCVTGVQVDIHGIAELDPVCSQISILWLLHGKSLDRTWMHPMAAQTIAAWNERRERLKEQDRLERRASIDQSQSPDLKLPNPGLLVASIDLRNHGSRLVSKSANRDETHGHRMFASDLFGTYQGTARDVSLLIPHIGSYLAQVFDVSRKIRDHYVAGVNVGGHAAWQILLQEPRVKGGIVFIGCADFVRLISKRVENAKLDSWLRGDGNGSEFLGSEDFPPALVDEVKSCDPAGSLLGKMFPPESFLHNAPAEDWTRAPTREELAQLIPIMEKKLAGKRILNIWGRKDNWVPHSASAPFLTWLSKAIGEDGWFEDGDLTLKEIVMEDLGHECPSAMYTLGIDWLIDTALGSL